jgi:short-subunit dehydrogenase
MASPPTSRTASMWPESSSNWLTTTPMRPWLVNAAGFFIPKPFLEHDGAFYDSYLELDRAIFFLTQTAVRVMVSGGRSGAIVNIGSMWAHQAVAAIPSSTYSSPRPDCTP